YLSGDSLRDDIRVGCGDPIATRLVTRVQLGVLHSEQRGLLVRRTDWVPVGSFTLRSGGVVDSVVGDDLEAVLTVKQNGDVAQDEVLQDVLVRTDQRYCGRRCGRVTEVAFAVLVSHVLDCRAKRAR